VADEYPLLIFPVPQPADRTPPSRAFPSGPRRPSWERQQERLAPQFAALERAFNQQRAILANDPAGAVPEKVLVLETIGKIEDFIKAVRRIPGMEWLGQWDETDIAPDDDFYRSESDRTGTMSGQVLLIMSDQQALRELQSLWQRYQTDRGRWEGGRTKWRDLFDQLRDIQPWDVQNRLERTGLIEDWQARVATNEERVRIEVELWFRGNEDDRSRSEAIVRRLVQDESGQVIKRVMISDIAYHALLLDMPIGAVSVMLETRETRLIRCDQVMFFRPIGQAAVLTPNDEPLSDQTPPQTLLALEEAPIVALLDGLPLENHQWLANRLLVDDPDGWAASYIAQERQHGTAMASLIIYGDPSARQPPLARRVYVRPILRPDPHVTPLSVAGQVESIPGDELPVDLVHRAVRRLFDPDGTEQPVAPEVRIINLSIGDPARPFDRYPSPWARLIDWLAWKYRRQAMFVISAGNCIDEVVLGVALSSSSPAELEEATLRAIAGAASHRAIIAPAESVNALTVGALHDDASTVTQWGVRTNIIQSSVLPSPITRLGPGFARSVKPDILMPGGRQLYAWKGSNANGTTLAISSASNAPGHIVATPGKTPGDLSATRHLRGTSNAAALATRTAAQLYDTLEGLRRQPDGKLLHEQYTPVLLKAMVVHGARWDNSYTLLKPALATWSTQERREQAARFLGYGAVDATRVSACTDQRATLIGCGELMDGTAHMYAIPLPPSLSGQKVYRRLTITLAWLTPPNALHHRYHRADLWFDVLSNPLKVDRREVTGRAVKRGTVQHEIFEGESATPYTDPTDLEIKVNCRALAGSLEDSVPYALVVSLEVEQAQGVLFPIPVYEEIRARLRVPIPIVPTNRVSKL